MGRKVDDEMYVDAPPLGAWMALVGAISGHPSLKVESQVEQEMRLEFQAGWSASTTGQRMSASVVPQGTGSLIRVGGVGKVSMQIGSASRIKKLIGEIFASTANRLGPVAPPPPL